MAPLLLSPSREDLPLYLTALVLPAVLGFIFYWLFTHNQRSRDDYVSKIPPRLRKELPKTGTFQYEVAVKGAEIKEEAKRDVIRNLKKIKLLVQRKSGQSLSQHEIIEERRLVDFDEALQKVESGGDVSAERLQSFQAVFKDTIHKLCLDHTLVDSGEVEQKASEIANLLLQLLSVDFVVSLLLSVFPDVIPNVLQPEFIIRVLGGETDDKEQPSVAIQVAVCGFIGEPVIKEDGSAPFTPIEMTCNTEDLTQLSPTKATMTKRMLSVSYEIKTTSYRNVQELVEHL